MDVEFATKKQEYNRNDYIGVLIDEKFNDTSEYGNIGKLELVSNSEGVATKEFLYRQLVFETVDFDMSMCERW